MVQGSSKPLSEEAAEGHQWPPQPARPAFDPSQHQHRDGHVSRLRSRRPARVVIDETQPGRAFGISATVMAWAVLVVGIGIAVVGAVQAMRTASEEPVPAAAADTLALSRQIEQLKIDLDRERAEKQDLLQKLAAAQAEAAPAPEAPAVAQKSDVTVAAEGEARDAATPAAPPDAGNVASVTAPEVQAPAPQGPAAEPALPAPMAPSAELLRPAGPAVADLATAEAGAASGFGVHLASFADRVMAERGWALLQRNHPAALGDLSPRIQDAKDEAGNPIYLLLAGPFQTQELAAAHCKSIRSQVVFCKARAFLGSELTAVQ